MSRRRWSWLIAICGDLALAAAVATATVIVGRIAGWGV